MREIKEAKIRKTNMKLYPIYKMIGYDLLFLYAIQILFLMQVKGCSSSEAVLLGSFYAFFSVIFTIPLNIVVSKIGKRNSMILGNIFNLIYILLLILGTNYYVFVLGELLEAVGFALKGITESAFLNESIPKAEKKSDIFTRIDGNAYSKYSYFNAIAMVLSGILYDINPYIPLICAAGCIICAIMLCVNFTELDNFKGLEDEDKDKSISEIYSELKQSLKFIFKSNRLRALLLMSALIIGLIRLMVSFNPTLLESIGCSATIIGICSAIFELVKGFSSNKSNDFNRMFKNKTYTIISLTITSSMFLAGLILLFNIQNEAKIAIVVLLFGLIYLAKGFYQVLRSRYLNNFSNSKILHNLYSVDTILENLSRMIMTFIGSAILNIADIKHAFIFIGIGGTILAIFASKYMKTRVGLKPEQYKKEDMVNAFEEINEYKDSKEKIEKSNNRIREKKLDELRKYVGAYDKVEYKPDSISGEDLPYGNRLEIYSVSVSEISIAFGSFNGQRIAGFEATAKFEADKYSFSFMDSWENRGKGTLEFDGDIIKLNIEITNYDEMANYNVSNGEMLFNLSEKTQLSM